MDGQKEKYIKHAAIVPLAGGFSLGASNIIGYPPEIILSYKAFYENDKLYLRYLKQHNIDVPYFQLDNLSDKINIFNYKIDFFHGILPCSALSQCSQLKAGTRTTYASVKWMYESADMILRLYKPKIYAFENAPGLYTGNGKEVRDKLIEIGKEYGYAITFYKTNTLKHGIPQFRPRTFALFLKGDKAPILNYYDKKAPLLSEYLKQIPKTASLQDAYMTEEWDITKWEITKYFKKIYGEDWRNTIFNFKTHTTSYDYLKRKSLLEDFLEFQKSLPDASDIVRKNTEHVIKKRDMNKNFRLAYRVLGLDRDYVYAVIGEMMHRTVHPDENRLINIREYMTLMNLPFDYELENPKEYAKITQNVPCVTCQDITTEIIEIIKGNRTLSKNLVLMQDNTKENEKIKTKLLF